MTGKMKNNHTIWEKQAQEWKEQKTYFHHQLQQELISEP